jgi:hypothetical protein
LGEEGSWSFDCPLILSDPPFPGVKEKEAGIWAIDFRKESPEKSEGHAFSSHPGET